MKLVKIGDRYINPEQLCYMEFNGSKANLFFAGRAWYVEVDMPADKVAALLDPSIAVPTRQMPILP